MYSTAVGITADWHIKLRYIRTRTGIFPVLCQQGPLGLRTSLTSINFTRSRNGFWSSKIAFLNSGRPFSGVWSWCFDRKWIRRFRTIQHVVKIKIYSRWVSNISRVARNIRSYFGVTCVFLQRSGYYNNKASSQSQLWPSRIPWLGLKNSG